MSAETDALARTLGAARGLKNTVETTTLKQYPLPPAAKLDELSAAVANTVDALAAAIQALENSAAVAAKKAQDTSTTNLKNNLVRLNEKIGQAAEALRKQGVSL